MSPTPVPAAVASETASRPMGLGNRRSALAAFAIIAVTTLLVFDGVLTGLTISNANYLFAFEPWVYYRRADQVTANPIMSDAIDWPNIFYLVDVLRQGELPMWGFNEQLGRPGIFVMNNLLVNPIRLALWTGLGVPVGWTVETLLKFSVSGFFMYLFLSELGVTFFLAVAFAIAFVFGSSSISSYSDAFAGIPLAAPIAFFFVERLARTRSWWASLGLMLSLFYVASQALAHIAFYLCYWVLLLIILRIATARHNRVDLAVKYVVAGIASILLFSYALLPTAEFFRNGINLAYREGYGVRQLHVRSIVNLFVANVFGDPLREADRWKYGTYVNSSVFVGFLAPIALLTGSLSRAIRRRELVTLFCLVATVFLFFDIYETPIEQLEAFTNRLPLFNGNPPIYQKTIIQFFIAVLGALALQHAIDSNAGPTRTRRLLRLLPLGVAVALVGWFVTATVGEVGITPLGQTYFTRIGPVIAVQILLLALIAGWPGIARPTDAAVRPANVPRRRLLATLVGGALVATCIAEAVINSRGWIPYARARDWFPNVRLTDFLHRRLGPGRVISLGNGVAVPETLAAYGFPVAAGRGPVTREYLLLLRTAWDELYMYHPTQSLLDPYETDLVAPIWDLLDVRYFVASRQLDTTTLDKYGSAIRIHALSDGMLLERRPTPAHARFVSDAVVVTGAEAILKEYLADWDINARVMVDSAEALLPADSPERDILSPLPAGTVTGYEQLTNSMRMDVETQTPGYLVLSSFHYPGWSATVDGQPAKIVRAYGFLSAVVLPKAGRQHVLVRYRPMSIVAGVSISLLTLLATSIFFLRVLRPKRPAAP